MAKLKLGALDDDKPVKASVELPATVHRNLIAYAEVLARERKTSQPCHTRNPMTQNYVASVL